MPIFLIMQWCDDPFYGSNAHGPAFGSYELAQKWITDVIALGDAKGCNYEGMYHIEQFDVQMTA